MGNRYIPPEFKMKWVGNKNVRTFGWNNKNQVNVKCYLVPVTPLVCFNCRKKQYTRKHSVFIKFHTETFPKSVCLYQCIPKRFSLKLIYTFAWSMRETLLTSDFPDWQFSDWPRSKLGQMTFFLNTKVSKFCTWCYFLNLQLSFISGAGR